jgi:hypothetical protein
MQLPDDLRHQSTNNGREGQKKRQTLLSHKDTYGDRSDESVKLERTDYTSPTFVNVLLHKKKDILLQKERAYSAVRGHELRQFRLKELSEIAPQTVRPLE